MPENLIISEEKAVFIQTEYPVSMQETFFSGQTFRWRIINENPPVYFSFIENNPVFIEQKEPTILHAFTSIENCSEEFFRERITRFLSLDIDNEIVFKKTFRDRHPELWAMVSEFEGLKVLRQNAFETAVTFMCAQGIGMPLIRRQTEQLCMELGIPVAITFRGKQRTEYRFPSPERVAEMPPEKLRRCTNNNCRRAENIRRMAMAVVEGSLDFSRLASPDLPLDAVQRELCRHAGIGPKIADCIALFGLGRFDAFPIDTHVRQYLCSWFGIGNMSGALTENRYRMLQEKALQELHPDFAGYAGHLLFHYWRRKVKNLNTA